MDARRPAIEPDRDNHDAIQTCIDATHREGGGTVELPSGPCPIGAPLELRSNVTLRGSGMIATVVRPTGYAGPVLSSDATLLGATVEDLTVAGGAGWDQDATGAAPALPSPVHSGRGQRGAIDLGAGASFCFLRRLRLTDLAHVAVRVAGGPIDHLYLEQVVVEGCGGDGIVLAPDGDAEGVFLTEVSVRAFGLADGSGTAGVRTSGRTFISQLHVQPIGPGAVGLLLEPGSDHTVASNVFFGIAGGVARAAVDGASEATVEAELVRDLLDHQLARTFP